MRFFWSAAAQADLDRLHDFLANYSLDAADAAIESIVNAPKALLDFPRRGTRVREFDPAEFRELRIGPYVMRYELRIEDIRVHRIYHARENRF